MAVTDHHPHGEVQVPDPEPRRGSTERNRLRELLMAARADRKRLRAKLDAAEAEVARVSRELAETKLWLQELERARTWRATAPLRRLGDALRRLRNRGGSGDAVRG